MQHPSSSNKLLICDCQLQFHILLLKPLSFSSINFIDSQKLAELPHERLAPGSIPTTDTFFMTIAWTQMN